MIQAVPKKGVASSGNFSYPQCFIFIGLSILTATLIFMS